MAGVFRDQSNHQVTLAGLAHGRPLVLIPVQYLCPNLCGLSLVGLDQAIARQPDRGFAVAALGIDPREGPAVAAKAVAGMKTPIVALTGPEAASRAVTVTVFAPACSAIPLADQLVVPLAVPAPPRLFAHLTCVTPTLSLAVPLSAIGLVLAV